MIWRYLAGKWIFERKVRAIRGFFVILQYIASPALNFHSAQAAPLKKTSEKKAHGIEK
jgi:hypothetical protein